MPSTNDRSKIKQQQHQPPIDNQSLETSLMSMFDEPIVTDEAIRIYEQCVAVAHRGAFEPSDVDRIAYAEYVTSLMITV